MCEPATLASMAMAAVGSGLQYKAQSDAASNQADAITNAQNEQSQLGGQRQDAVFGAGQKFVSPTLGQATAPAAERLKGVAQQAQDFTNRANTPSDGMSGQDYSLDHAKRAAEEMKRAIGVAQNTAQANAPARLMQTQGLGMADSMSGVDGISGLMKRAASRAQGTINKAGMVDPGMMAAGSMISGMSGAGGTALSKLIGGGKKVPIYENPEY